MLDPQNRLMVNVDNGYLAGYLSKVTNQIPATVSDTNTYNSPLNAKSLYGSGDSLYSVAPAGTAATMKLGYKGLQIEGNNTLTEAVATKLFTKNREDALAPYKGLLYKYGSKESLLKKVNQMTS